MFLSVFFLSPEVQVKKPPPLTSLPSLFVDDDSGWFYFSVRRHVKDLARLSALSFPFDFK